MENGQIWIGASFQDENLEWLSVKSYDFHIKMLSQDVGDKWQKMEFFVGNNQRHKLYVQGKFMCICVFVVRGKNYFELCGTDI